MGRLTKIRRQRVIDSGLFYNFRLICAETYWMWRKKKENMNIVLLKNAKTDMNRNRTTDRQHKGLLEVGTKGRRTKIR